MNEERRTITEYFDTSTGRRTATRLETDKEMNDRLKREKEKKEEEYLISTVTDHEYRVHKLLEEMINELGGAGVDVSYFPHQASLVLIRYAKKIGQL